MRRRMEDGSEVEQTEEPEEQIVEETQDEAPAEAAAEPPVPKENTRTIGGMVETKWSGLPMWKCPRCRGTTFKASEASSHVCKTPKMADEAEE